MKRKIMALFIMAALCVSLLPMGAFAATKSMTAYNYIYKTGSTVYCTDSSGIFKVNLSSKTATPLYKGGCDVHALKYNNGYIYFIEGSEGTEDSYRLMRVSTSKSLKALHRGVVKYAISGSYIYYKWSKLDNYRYGRMNLNGSNTVKTTIKPSMTTVKTNNSNYHINYDNGATYLKTKSGSIKLETIKRSRLNF